MKTVNDIYKALNERHIPFSGSHDVHTPQSIVTRLINNITITNQEFLVLYNIEFAVSLVYTYNVDPQKITFFADHPNKIKFANKLNIKYVTAMEDIQMKSRPVLLTNPPYTDGTQGAAEIYTSIISNCIEKFNPIAICGVTPENLINGGQKKEELRNLLFKKYGLKTVKFLDQNRDWNRDIAISTIAWVVEEGYSGLTKVTGRQTGNEYDVNVNGLGLTELINGESQEVHDWLISIQTTHKLKLKSSKKTGKTGQQAKISKGSPFSLIVESGSEYNSHNTEWRVAFGYMRCNTCAVVPPGISIPSKYRYINFGSNQQAAEKFYSYMLSEPIRLILKMTYTSRTLDNPQLSYVPMIDLNKLTQVDDQTLYALWNTTPATQLMINSMVGDEVPF